MIAPTDIVRAFRNKRVLIVGDAMLDGYLEGSASRLSPEGPVPVVRIQRESYLPGGAANTAVNASALGAEAILLSVVGDDQEAGILGRSLLDHSVAVDHLLKDPGRCTTTKSRVIADSQCLLRFDREEVFALDRGVETQLIARLRDLFPVCDVVIVSDYLKGVITPRVVSELARLNENQSKLVVVDSKDLARRRFRNVSLITPNHLDAQRACSLRARPLDGCPYSRYLESLGRELLRKIHTQWVMITLGESGVLLFERGQEMLRVGARQVPEAHIAGAGDTFTTVVALSLSCFPDIKIAAEMASEAASIVVGKRRTAYVTQHELLQHLSLAAAEPKVTNNILGDVQRYKCEGKRIVFTNGVFDSLHSGHIAYLREAKKLGDVLIVGVNSDKSLQSAGRCQQVVNSEEERLSLVAALSSVDHAVLFDEETPARLIREIRPQIHVKGGDYLPDALPEGDVVREVGGRIVILPLLERKSPPAMIRNAGETPAAAN